MTLVVRDQEAGLSVLGHRGGEVLLSGGADLGAHRDGAVLGGDGQVGDTPDALEAVLQAGRDIGRGTNRERVQRHEYSSRREAKISPRTQVL